MTYVKEIFIGAKAVKRTAEEKRKAKELNEEKRKEDEKLVKGMFKNLEAPGGDLQFAYKAYEGPVQIYHLYDGKTYELPFGVAKHINNQTRTPTKEYVPPTDEKSPIQTRVTGYRQRYQFIPLDYS